MNKHFKKNKNLQGFTIIELLGVILLIALLLTITMSGANKLYKTARGKKIQIMKNTLANVVTRFYEDYGEWPVVYGTGPGYLSPTMLNGGTLKKGDWTDFGENFQSLGHHTKDDIWEEFEPDSEKGLTDAGIMYGGTPKHSNGTINGGDNVNFFENLLVKEGNKNTKNIIYVDETTFSCWVNGRIWRIHERPGVGPWCFRDVDGKYKKFKIVLRPIDKKVMVGTGDEIK